jgi:hypothetical protein
MPATAPTARAECSQARFGGSFEVSRKIKILPINGARLIGFSDLFRLASQRASSNIAGTSYYGNSRPTRPLECVPPVETPRTPACATQFDRFTRRREGAKPARSPSARATAPAPGFGGKQCLAPYASRGASGGLGRPQRRTGVAPAIPVPGTSRVAAGRATGGCGLRAGWPPSASRIEAGRGRMGALPPGRDGNETVGERPVSPKRSAVKSVPGTNFQTGAVDGVEVMRGLRRAAAGLVASPTARGNRQRRQV